MIVYLYALADGLADIVDCVGAGGEALRVLPVESFVAVAGDLAEALPLERQSLEAQDQVVRALHQRSESLLPMRFGAVYASEGEAIRAVQSQAGALGERLRRVRLREQMTLRVTAAAGEREPRFRPQSGTTYLKQRATPDEIRPLLESLRPLQHGTIVEPGRTSGMVATVYQLIDRGTSAAYGESVRRVAAAHPELMIHVSGPGPCYAFT